MCSPRFSSFLSSSPSPWYHPKKLVCLAFPLPLTFQIFSANFSPVQICNSFHVFNCAEDEHEFSYESGAENGPEHWGEINVNWTRCGTGHQQSPIDLLNERVQVNPYMGRLLRSYRLANAIMKNRGHDIEVISASSLGYCLLYRDHVRSSINLFVV